MELATKEVYFMYGQVCGMEGQVFGWKVGSEASRKLLLHKQGLSSRQEEGQGRGK